MKNITKLNEEEFNSTFIPPMKFMDVDDETSEVELKLIVESVIESENLKITIEELSIDSIYHNSNKTYEHILINYGIKNMFLVIVIELKDKVISGYYLLDLSNKYGLNN